MFSVHCPRHGSEVLLSTRDIEGIDPTPTGIEVRWRCVCGHDGRTRTGRPRPRATEVL